MSCSGGKRLEDKIAMLKEEMRRLKKLETRMLKTPDQQIPLIDPNGRSMKTRGNGIVGYNVQTAVEAKHHLIVAHEVTNKGSDRKQLSPEIAMHDRQETTCRALGA